MESRFEQRKTLKDAGITLKSSGAFKLRSGSAGSEVDWTVEKPAYLNLHITESSLNLSEKAGDPGRPVVESKEVQARILRPIYAWLTMDSARIAEQFDIDRCGAAFLLTPKDKESPVQRMVMKLDKEGLVRSVELGEKSGDWLLIAFLDTKVTNSTAGAGGKNQEKPAK